MLFQCFKKLSAWSPTVSRMIATQPLYLRIAKLVCAYAFHCSQDGSRWLLIRHFRLGDPPEVEIGFLAQSPMGEGCTAHFRQITYRQEKLADIRSQA